MTYNDKRVLHLVISAMFVKSHQEQMYKFLKEANDLIENTERDIENCLISPEANEYMKSVQNEESRILWMQSLRSEIP
jgi:hypothetical protein